MGSESGLCGDAKQRREPTGSGGEDLSREASDERLPKRRTFSLTWERSIFLSPDARSSRQTRSMRPTFGSARKMLPASALGRTNVTGPMSLEMAIAPL